MESGAHSNYNHVLFSLNKHFPIVHCCKNLHQKLHMYKSQVPIKFEVDTKTGAGCRGKYIHYTVSTLSRRPCSTTAEVIL